MSANPTTPTGTQPARPTSWKRYAVLTVVIAFFAFWIWALFFASKESVNRIDDRAWAARAEEICKASVAERETMADYTRIDQPTPELMVQRADIVDKATDLIEAMLDEVVDVAPTDAKGLELIPRWEADFRTYIEDRRAYTESIRAEGRNLPFYETADTGIPLSDKVATFALDNGMSSCAPPRDLSQ